MQTQDDHDGRSLHFIVSCLEELRAEDAPAAAAAVPGSRPHSAAVGDPQVCTAAAGPALIDGADAAGGEDAIAQEAARSLQPDALSMAAVAPHKQTPFAGAKAILFRFSGMSTACHSAL